MAGDVKKIIDIVFRGVDQTSTITRDLSSGIDDFAGNVGKISGPMASAANKALALEGAILGVAAAFTGYAYVATAKYESSLLDLQKVMTDSEGSVEDYNDEIRRLSLTYGTTASDVLAGITSFKVAGFEMTESIELMENATKLMIAGDVQAAEATEILIATLKGFKSEAGESARIVDILNEVSNNYATNVTELGVGMARISPIANLMGFSFEETAGILVPVIEVFRSGSEAANALKTGLLRLLDDSKPVQDALAQLGVSQRDANGSFRSGKDILYDVAKAFQTADENSKTYLATELVGIFQAGKMVEVFNGLSKTMDVTSTAMEAFGSAQKEVNLRLGSIEVSLQRAAVAFDAVAQSFGKRLAPEITAMVNQFTELETAISMAIDSGAFDPLLDAIKPVIKELEQIFADVARNLPAALADVDFTGLSDALGSLRGEFAEAFEALFGEVDVSTVEGVTEVIQRVVDGVEALTRVTGGIIEVWQPFLRALGDGIDAITESDDATKEFIGRLGGIAQQVDIVVRNIGILTGGLNLVGTGLTLIGGAQMVKAVAGLKSLGAAGIGAAAGLGKLAAAGVVFAGGWEIGTALREALPWIDEATQGFFELSDRMLNWTGTQGRANETIDETVERLRANIEAGEEWRRQNQEPVVVETQFEVTAKGDDAEAIKDILTGGDGTGMPSWAQGLTVPWVLEGEVKIDEESIADAKNIVDTELVRWFDDETQTWKEKEFKITPSVDDEAAERELDKIPTEKRLEMILQGEIDEKLLRIEEEFTTIRELAQIEATLEIASIEATTERIKSAFDSVNVGIQSTGDTIASLANTLIDAQGTKKWDIERYIDREFEFRKQEFELQRELANSTKSLNDAKRKFFSGEGGTANIVLETTGIYPELDLVLEEIVRRAQIKVNTLGLGTLLGIDNVAQ